MRVTVIISASKSRKSWSGIRKRVDGMAMNLKLRGWIQAARPRVFTASWVPMGIAAMVAAQDGVFVWWKWLLAVLGVMLLQTTANLVNEYMDFQRGSDQHKQAGQSMSLKQNLLTPREVLIGAIIVTVLGVAIGLFLLTQSGPWLWAIGIGGVLIAITYTAGPFPLAYHGLGEVAAGIFMGPMIVLGAYYVMNPAIPAEMGVKLSLISFPIMFTTAAILHANNIRDLDADRTANKRTLAVLFGLRIARIEYAVLLILCYLSQVILVTVGWIPPATLLTLLTVPQAIRLTRTFFQETDVQKLHVAQGATAKLHGLIGLVMVIGWAITLLIS
jgi:1,4-dihydroxy-2-naphthoate octaprenyltransferase